MLKKNRFVILLLLFAACRQAYVPPAIKAPNHYLVVEGVINTLPDSKTTIQLSGTRNLTDTSLAFNPETGARIIIQAKSGTTYPLTEQTAGQYAADHLTLNKNDLYRLNIRTTNGEQYLSDYVPVKQTPPIDSITWKQENGVTIYASTHDPANNSRYYRWDFTETWQYQAFLMGNYGLGVSNGMIFIRDATTQEYNCWQTAPSTDIILASSIRLSQDVIDHFPMANIPDNSEKLAIRYSTLVRQYALTEDAYNYWQILQKNTQSLGTLFDAEPGQLSGNIHSVSNPNEPVIGYVSACDIQQQRIFIDHLQLSNWNPPVPSPSCDQKVIPQNPNNFLIWDYPDTSYEPWYFVSGGGLMIAKRECLDCRLKGGTNQKPSFWQ